MNKREFLNELNRLTSGLNEAERARLNDYYSEMIDDRVEEGICEEDAVAALGDPSALAKELSAPGSASRGDAPVGSAQTVEALNSLRVHVANADVTVVRETLDNGAAAQLRLSDPARFECRMEGDTLKLSERKVEAKNHGLEFGLRWLRQMITEPNLRVTIVLSEAFAGALDIEGGGSDICVEGVSFSKAQLITGSGDIRLKKVECAGGIGIDIRTHSGDVELTDARSTNLMINTASGDISGSGLALSGRARLEASSGNIELRELDCGELSVNTASGDIEFDRGRAGATTVHSASGDVRLNELETNPSLCVETASGDIELCRCIAVETRLSAVSGDVSLKLEPLPYGYDISATSVSGDIQFDKAATKAPADAQQPKIHIRTVSGDVEAELIE